jgi:hypothetical protein
MLLNFDPWMVSACGLFKVDAVLFKKRYREVDAILLVRRQAIPPEFEFVCELDLTSHDSIFL